MAPSLDEMEFYLRLADWTYKDNEWIGPTGLHALSIEYAYCIERWSEGYKDILSEGEKQ